MNEPATCHECGGTLDPRTGDNDEVCQFCKQRQEWRDEVRYIGSLVNEAEHWAQMRDRGRLLEKLRDIRHAAQDMEKALR